MWPASLQHRGRTTRPRRRLRSGAYVARSTEPVARHSRRLDPRPFPQTAELLAEGVVLPLLAVQVREDSLGATVGSLTIRSRASASGSIGCPGLRFLGGGAGLGLAGPGMMMPVESHLTMSHVSLRSSPGRAPVKRSMTRICLKRASVRSPQQAPKFGLGNDPFPAMFGGSLTFFQGFLGRNSASSTAQLTPAWRHGLVVDLAGPVALFDQLLLEPHAVRQVKLPNSGPSQTASRRASAWSGSGRRSAGAFRFRLDGGTERQVRPQ